MTLHAYMAFFTVGAMLVLLGLVLLLAAPAPGVVVLLLGLVHLLIGIGLRERIRRHETHGLQP